MFRYSNSINPEMLKHIRESTNKSIERYKRSVIFDKKEPPSLYALLPFVSFISFLAGYNLNKLLKN